jgi:hypothetical protein
VIQHYAPVVGWGGEEQVHNVDYDPVNFNRPYFHLVIVMEPSLNIMCLPGIEHAAPW